MTKDTPEVSIHELTSCGCSGCKEEVILKTQPIKPSQPSAGAWRAAAGQQTLEDGTVKEKT